MNLYIEKLKSYLAESSDPNGDMLMEQLYILYKEIHPMDTEEIKAEFANLDSILSKLPLRDYDSLWDVACRLCSEHESVAFREGIRIGVRLMLENTKI